MRCLVVSTILSFLLLVSPAWSQCPGPYCPSPAIPGAGSPDPVVPDEPISSELEQQIRQASVIVYSLVQQGASASQYAKGSGTIIKIGDSVAVITAGHVVQAGSPAYVQTIDGLKIRYRVVHYDTTIDYAILEPLSNQEELYVRGVLLHAGEYPQSVYILGGYDGRITFRIWKARFRRGVFVSRTQLSYWIELDRPATQGDSGGGIFTPNGRLAAIIWGTDGSTTIATTITPVAEYLLAHYPTCFLWRRSNPAGPAPRPSQPPRYSPPGPSPEPGPAPSENKPAPDNKPPELVPVPKPEEKPQPEPKPEVKPQPETPVGPSLWQQIRDGLILGLIAFAVYLLIVGTVVTTRAFQDMK